MAITFRRSLLRVALVYFFVSGYALAHIHGQELPPTQTTLEVKPEFYEAVTLRPAFDWKPLAAYSAAQGLDIWSTHRFLTNGSGCTEGHSYFFGGTRPSGPQLAAGYALSVGIMAGYQVGLYQLGKLTHRPVLFRRLAQGVGYGGTALEVGVSVKNLRECR